MSVELHEERSHLRQGQLFLGKMPAAIACLLLPQRPFHGIGGAVTEAVGHYLKLWVEGEWKRNLFGHFH